MDDRSEVRREIAPSGSIRFAINLGNSVLAQPSDKPPGAKGISVCLAKGIAEALDLPAIYKTYNSAGAVYAVADKDEWDVAFLAVDPKRAEVMTFTKPYIEIEATYLVRAGSDFRKAADLDRDGVTIAVGLNAAYDLYLSRTLHRATLVRETTGEAALALFYGGGTTAAAGIRQPLTAYAEAKPDLRVLEDSFDIVRQAICTPHGRPRAIAFIDAFLVDFRCSALTAMTAF